jgi:hypothetical protein
MKLTFLTYLLLATGLQCHCQQNTGFHFSAKPDSIIEKRQSGYIYITKDTGSPLYNYLIPDPGDSLAQATYTILINDIRERYGQQTTRFSIKGFPRKWNSVYFYKGEYVLYAPSDWIANSGYYISDSAIYITGSDPGEIYVIKEFRSKGIEAGTFKVINQDGAALDISIRVKNKTLGIYEWSIGDKAGKPETFLMQDTDFRKKLRMVVCDCGNQKCHQEFDFTR